MPQMNTTHLPLYEGDEDPKLHWFIYERIWDAIDITDEAKRMEQFIGALRTRELTWFMNFIKKHTQTKDEIKKKKLTFFKTQNNKHLDAQKLK